MAIKYTNYSIQENIHKFLTPQPSLDRRVFNKDMQIHPHIKQKLWQKAEAVINLCNNYFPMFEIEDVVLLGSLSSYMWHDKSDFDIKIIIKFNAEKSFIKDKQKAFNLFSRCLFFIKNKLQKLYVIDKLVDIKITDKIPDNVYGLYSLKKDCWLKKPTTKLTAKINPQKLYNVAMKRIFALNKILYIDTKRIKGRVPIEWLKHLLKIRNEAVNKQYSGVFEYLVYKLIAKEAATFNIYRFYNQELPKSLSIEIDDL